MNQLHHYLSEVESYLTALSSLERARAIVEIEQKLRTKKESNLSSTWDEVIREMGSARSVAQSYFPEGSSSERPKSNLWKWFVFGFGGLFLMSIVGIGLALWKFTPIVDINEESGRIQILGGFIDIDETEGKIKIGPTIMDRKQGSLFLRGSRPLDPSQFRLVEIQFANGSVEVEAEESSTFSYDCQLEGATGKQPASLFSERKGTFRLDLRDYSRAKCEIHIPQSIEMKISGNNGTMELHDLRSTADVVLNNGNVTIDSDDDIQVRYELSVLNGKIDSFESSSDPRAAEIRVRVGNGQIRRAD